MRREPQTSQKGWSLTELLCVMSLGLSIVGWSLRGEHLEAWNRLSLQQESFRLFTWLNTLKRYAHRTQRPLSIRWILHPTPNLGKAWKLEATTDLSGQPISTLCSMDSKTILHPPTEEQSGLQLFGFRNTALATHFTLCRQNACIQIILSSKARIRRCALTEGFGGIALCTPKKPDLPYLNS